MEIIPTVIDPSEPQFQANAQFHRQLAEELRSHLAQVRQGGEPKYHQRHIAQGKRFVRERIERLLDPGAPFLELSPLAAWDVYPEPTPAAGIVTGIGRVSGREVKIVFLCWRLYACPTRPALHAR